MADASIKGLASHVRDQLLQRVQLTEAESEAFVAAVVEDNQALATYDEMACLRAALRARGVSVADVAADGNCFFAACEVVLQSVTCSRFATARGGATGYRGAMGRCL